MTIPRVTPSGGAQKAPGSMAQREESIPRHRNEAAHPGLKAERSAVRGVRGGEGKQGEQDGGRRRPWGTKLDLLRQASLEEKRVYRLRNVLEVQAARPGVQVYFSPKPQM